MNALFFDLDGTLLDTLPDIALSLNEALSSASLPVCSLAQLRTFVGNGARKLVERAVPAGADTEAVYAAFRSRYGGSTHALTRPYEGIGELLARAKERGMKLAVITNKPQEAAETAAEKFFPSLFDFVGGDSGLFPLKPDPSLARYCALSLRVPLRECVFIGDGEADILTARNAGMRSVCALWGYRRREELERAGGTEFASSPEELQKILFDFSSNP